VLDIHRAAVTYRPCSLWQPPSRCALARARPPPLTRRAPPLYPYAPAPAPLRRATCGPQCQCDGRIRARLPQRAAPCAAMSCDVCHGCASWRLREPARASEHCSPAQEGARCLSTCVGRAAASRHVWNPPHIPAKSSSGRWFAANWLQRGLQRAARRRGNSQCSVSSRDEHGRVEDGSVGWVAQAPAGARSAARCGRRCIANSLPRVSKPGADGDVVAYATSRRPFTVQPPVVSCRRGAKLCAGHVV